jgi:hypothetical protein
MAFLQKNGDLCLFGWFCWEECDGSNVAFFYGGGVVKKAIEVGGFFFSFFLFIWSFWFSSLKLTINNETMVFFYVESYNG